jgi:predicted metalloprotease with PDZ domain
VVPYGRGFFYLANVDAQIKKATGNQKSLDDVVLFILDIARKGTKPTVDNWLEQVKSFIGEQAIIDYENMISGQLIVPDPSAFGGAFKVTQKEIELEDTKKKVEGFVWEINADVKTPIV